MKTFMTSFGMAFMLTFALLTVGYNASKYGSVNMGIIPLGSTGNGVLLCGEAITLNATKDVSRQELEEMFHAALDKMNTECPTGKE
jgi:hypothetical protein